MKKYFKIIVSIFILFILNSCSYVSFFFVQNYKNEDVKIDIKFDHIIDENISKNMPILFTSNVKNVKDFNNDVNKIKLEYTKIDESTISVILPKNSITKIDNAINKKTNVKEIVFFSNNQLIKLGENEILKNSKSNKWGIVYHLK
ncbi:MULTISPECIES: hypothetical protein [Empedobacter]|uniref:hypothetical protein n=1 Tax=Empedobacter TaxID=59734 RepID=UPI001269FE14|nr:MULTISPECIES: hypothetical protein [Empedobacter]MDH0674349.1 hypothetical protein [Empedobacter sp. GD03861]